MKAKRTRVTGKTTKKEEEDWKKQQLCINC